VAIVSTCRAKPYSTDLLASIVITLLGIQWLRRPDRCWPIVVLALAAPCAIWFSYTSIFVIGGVVPVVALRVLLGRKALPRLLWPALVGLVAAVGVSLGLLYTEHVETVMTAAGSSGLKEHWSDAFPPSVGHPLRFLWWLITTHTGRLYAYPVGEKNFASTLSLVLWIAGVMAVWRRRQGRWIVSMLLLPQALLLAAAILGFYPYGGHSRISIFLAPAMCLFIGAGIAHATQGAARRRWRAPAAILIMLLPLGAIAGDLVRVGLFWNKPSVRGMIAELSSEYSPGDHIFCPGEPRGLRGGGTAMQIFEYYLERLLGNRVRRGAFSSMALPEPGKTLYVIVFDSKARHGEVPVLPGNAAFKTLRLIDSRRCRIHPAKPANMVIRRYVAGTPTPSFVPER
jgi:hypothetical protein